MAPGSRVDSAVIGQHIKCSSSVGRTVKSSLSLVSY